MALNILLDKGEADFKVFYFFDDDSFSVVFGNGDSFIVRFPSYEEEGITYYFGDSITHHLEEVAALCNEDGSVLFSRIVNAICDKHGIEL